MSGVNKVILIGHLGKDPEVQHFEGGVSKAAFSIATSEKYKNREGQQVEQTEWHNIVVWRGLADVAEKYLRKGNLVYVEGKLRTRSWDDKETGAKKYMTEVVADNFTMLGGRKGDNEGGSDSTGDSGSSNSNQADVAADNSPEDDLPF